MSLKNNYASNLLRVIEKEFNKIYKFLNQHEFSNMYLSKITIHNNINTEWKVYGNDFYKSVFDEFLILFAKKHPNWKKYVSYDEITETNNYYHQLYMRKGPVPCVKIEYL